ncbi:alkaline phosphatase [Polaribacter reichenbachii]|uniref:Alkaline phosphatase n=1 Tax=Polaribacter reichenbachii TaxID=996801 RepID=A0A1B8U476_9FLAO|nr:alkaline phosphatase PhoX [Polaribacter reichenbachii]APZ47408.1 alkaline phosphatase [Polaribacter reichenbachii]AUC18047.1 alkaline phosphatase [Polaribacter reichenbachii]OBY66657.1 alkaline phosphatase [Polaribacter reichenbachii]
MDYNRRKFISFMGKASLASLVLPQFLMSCGNTATPTKDFSKMSKERLQALKDLVLEGIPASDKDDLLLAKGLDYHTIVKWGDAISDTDTFGFNNDYTCFIPFDENNPKDGLLWVNHEYVNQLFVSDFDYRAFDNPKAHRTKAQVDKEMYNVGGSIIRIKEENGIWQVVQNDPHNRRITAQTDIALNWDAPIKGKTSVKGTLANCSGGITPWKTFITCEENYDGFFGETEYDDNNVESHRNSGYGWENFYNYPPEHYGWVVEVNPKDGKAQKHIALGRFAHECCTLYELEDKRVVAYTGDDHNDEHLYKFVSSKPGSLKEGTLYVADTINGQWLALDYENQPVLKAKFKNQTEVLIRAREAAKLIGATPLNRPEDIEIDPITGHIFITLTNNKPKGDHHGSILKIVETNGAFDALTFKSSTYIAGGTENGFSCPDNLAFDMAGNLWITTDMSGGAMNRTDKPYMAFKNNSLFVIPRLGKDAGKVIRVASAPKDAELTGPWFSPDGKTLFLSVQHPGEQTKDLSNPTSTWPFDKDNIPKPAVVAITGDLIEKMNHLNKLEG